MLKSLNLKPDMPDNTDDTIEDDQPLKRLKTLASDEADAAPLERGAQGEEALVRALAAAGDDEGARGALARKDVGELQQAARAAEDGGRAPRQEPRAEGEAALEGAAGESLERHGPTSLS